MNDLKMSINRYYKKKLVNQNIEVEYNSGEDEVTIEFKHVLNSGDHIATDRMRIHPSYVEPLVDLLREIVKNESNEVADI